MNGTAHLSPSLPSPSSRGHGRSWSPHASPHDCSEALNKENDTDFKQKRNSQTYTK